MTESDASFAPAKNVKKATAAAKVFCIALEVTTTRLDIFDSGMCVTVFNAVLPLMKFNQDMDTICCPSSTQFFSSIETSKDYGELSQSPILHMQSEIMLYVVRSRCRNL